MDGAGRDHGLILHAGRDPGGAAGNVNLWPSRAESDAAAADPRRLSALRAEAIGPDSSTEHHEVERYVLLDRGRAAAMPSVALPQPRRRRRGYELRSASVTSWSTDTWST